jgi:hypothetical protein
LTKRKARILDLKRAKPVPKINEYVYTPIDHHNDIRILKILRGSEGDPLMCMLFPSAAPSSSGHSKLDSFPYAALSYCWGDDNPIYPVEMFWSDTGEHDNAPTGRVFYIRRSLNAALRQLRDPYHGVDIWVDALCINQADNVEKKTQVAGMHRIYSAAKEVIVWLGEGNDEIRKTFDLLRSILDLQELEKLTTDETKCEQWICIIKLMRRPWFTRRWVIQELLLAKKAIVMCAAESMPWELFADALALFRTKLDVIQAHLNKPKSLSRMGDSLVRLDLTKYQPLEANTLVDATSNLFRKSDDGSRIETRLVDLEVLVTSTFLALESSDPRDIIYAVLSLAKDMMPRRGSIGRPWWIGNTRYQILRLFKALFCCIVFFYRCLASAVLAKELSLPPNSPSIYVDDRLAPDYEKSLTDVFGEFMDYCIEKSGSLDILCRHWVPMPKTPTNLQKFLLKMEGREEEKEHLPTWIPLIKEQVSGEASGIFEGVKNANSLVGIPGTQNQQPFRASKALLPAVAFGKYRHTTTYGGIFISKRKSTFDEVESTSSESHSPPRLNKFDGTLHVKGFQLGTIVKLAGRALNGVVPHEALEFGGWPKRPRNDEYPKDVPERLWRTLVANRGPHGMNTPAWYRRACRESLNHTNRNGDLNTNEFTDLQITGVPMTVEAFLERVRGVIWGRKFFLADENEEERAQRHFGLAPSLVREYDIICIFFGCSVPVVLRESRTHPGLYEFIGECYIYGMMDGEALHPDIPPHPYKEVKGFTLV